MTRLTHPLAVLALAAIALPASAQDEMPAVGDEQPAVQTTPAPRPSRPATAPSPQMNVIGDQEAPIGLTIMPWRRAAATQGLDRPARLLDEALLPLDWDGFQRQVNYHRALTRHLEKTGRDTPG